MSDSFYKGKAERLQDLDLPRIGHEIGVGEDVLHMLIEVETRGTGYDKKNRVIMLFEPHIFFRQLSKDKEKLDRAVRNGLAYRKWGTMKYPKDSYPRFLNAVQIDETAAYASCSWGLGQIMGSNHKMAGYDSPQEMVKAFAESEGNQLDAMVDFAKSAGIDDDLQRLDRKLKSGQKITPEDCIPIARAWNGSGFASHNYHGRLAAAANKWHRIKDTPFTLEDLRKAAEEESTNAEVENQVFETEEPPEIETPDEHEVLTPDEKGVTITSPEKKDEVAGVPPPAPAIEIKASQPSLMSRLTSLSIPAGVGTVIAGIKAFATNMPPEFWYVIGGIFIVSLIIGAWLYNESMKRAQQRTDKVMEAAAAQNKNNLRLV